MLSCLAFLELYFVLSVGEKTRMQRSLYLDGLPPELWQYILFFVSPTDVAKSVMLVCKEMYQLSRDDLLWKHFYSVAARQRGVDLSYEPKSERELSWFQRYQRLMLVRKYTLYQICVRFNLAARKEGDRIIHRVPKERLG